jgi:hypothetical protein
MGPWRSQEVAVDAERRAVVPLAETSSMTPTWLPARNRLVPGDRPKTPPNRSLGSIFILFTTDCVGKAALLPRMRW